MGKPFRRQILMLIIESGTVMNGVTSMLDQVSTLFFLPIPTKWFILL